MSHVVPGKTNRRQELSGISIISTLHVGYILYKYISGYFDILHPIIKIYPTTRLIQLSSALL